MVATADGSARGPNELSGFPLPQLTGTWLRARHLIATWGLAQDLSGVRVHLNAGATLAGTQMFADEMVRSILVERCAEQLVVSLVGPVLNEQFQRAADHFGASDRLCVYSGPGPAG